MKGDDITAHTRRILVWEELAAKYLYPKDGEVVRLAGRIRNSREYAAGKVPEEFRPFYAQDAKELAREIRAGLEAVEKALFNDDGDVTFLRRLSDAFAMVKKGKISRSLGSIGAAVYAYRELAEESGCWFIAFEGLERCRPTGKEVIDRVNFYRRESVPVFPRISADTERRILQVLAPLLDE